MVIGYRALVASVAVVLLIPGCRGRSYPSDAARAMIASCSAEPNASKAGCLCILAEYEQKYSYAEYKALDAQLQAGNPSPELQTFLLAAGQHCAAKGLNSLPRCFFSGWGCRVHGMWGKCMATYVPDRQGYLSPQNRCNPD